MKIRSAPTQRDIARQIASERLAPETAAEFTKLQKKINETASKRDEIVHGIWATNDNPLTLIWLDPRSWVMWSAALTQKVSSESMSLGDFQKLSEGGRLVAFEYEEKDFIEVEDSIVNRLEQARDFVSRIQLRAR